MAELSVRSSAAGGAGAPSGLTLAPAATASRGSRGSSEGSSTTSDGATKDDTYDVIGQLVDYGTGNTCLVSEFPPGTPPLPHAD